MADGAVVVVAKYSAVGYDDQRKGAFRDVRASLGHFRRLLYRWRTFL